MELIAIALDEDIDAARSCAREETTVPLTYPVLIDRDHAWAEAYGVINVPTTIWVDEDDRVVRPPSIAPADDKFIDFTKIQSALHHDALRHWVIDDVVPMSDAELRAATTAERNTPARPGRAPAGDVPAARGFTDAGHAHLRPRLELAPDDWTIQRGRCPCAVDPFGQDFMDFYQRWEESGRPGYDS